MRPLETEHQGWKVRVIAHPVGQGWSALVEVWPPESADTAEARVVPFSGTLSSEKLAQDSFLAVLSTDLAGPVKKPGGSTK